MKRSLIFICITCALLTIFFQYHERQLLWIFKPLPLMIMISWLSVRGAPTNYRTWIVIGLLFSMIGDIFLIIPEIYFLHGLCSFFVAHICYIIAFWNSKKGFRIKSLWAFGYGLAMYLVVERGIPTNLKFPVAAYTLAISSMLCLALNFWMTHPSFKSKIALAGAMLFVISDSLMAINKFSYPFFIARILILVTYFTAQGLISSSVDRKKLS